MKKFLNKNKINFLFLFISFLFLIGILGINNIFFSNIAWLHNGRESAFNQLGWFFFKNDIWRFPLGSNPNYGDELGLSIIFTDSIPLLALFFKLFKSIIPENFQYFSLWYFICFYLQLYFSFKILKKFTNSINFSLVGSIFFLIVPIFLYRINYHVSLVPQWLLLFTLYLGLNHKVDKSKLLWIFLIIFSSLIEFYFTAMILVVYFILRISNFYYEKENFFNPLKDFFTVGILLLSTLYIIGYFEIRVVDSLGLGFGYYKLNLLSFFDPINSTTKLSWSWLLKDIQLSPGEETEGFNYLGLGQILMFLFTITLFLIKDFRRKISFSAHTKEIKTFFLISIIFTLWALSNKISIGSYTLLEIPLNKYIFGLLSIIKSTGRLFWIVNYFLLILSIVVIYKSFSKKKSLTILSLFLLIQIADTSAGIKDRLYFSSAFEETVELKDQIWNGLFKKYKIIKTTYPVNWSGIFGNFSLAMEKNNIEKTNIVIFGRGNRKLAAQARYQLYDNFRKKKLLKDTIYVIDGLGHLRHLKYLFNDENVGFYHRDNIWIMIMNEKEKMNNNDKKIFNSIKPKLLKINERKDLYFKDNDNYYGFGWSHNLQKLGIWSEGSISSLFFRTEKDYSNLKLEFFCKANISKKNNKVEFDVYINDTFNKTFKLTNDNKEEKIEIIINEQKNTNNEVKVDFKFKNLISPYEALESPDSRKLGILLESIKIMPI